MVFFGGDGFGKRIELKWCLGVRQEGVAASSQQQTKVHFPAPKLNTKSRRNHGHKQTKHQKLSIATKHRFLCPFRVTKILYLKIHDKTHPHCLPASSISHVETSLHDAVGLCAFWDFGDTWGPRSHFSHSPRDLAPKRSVRW